MLEGVTREHSELLDSLKSSAPPPSPRKRRLSVSDYVEGVLTRNRTIIAQTITLVESNHAKHMETAQEVLKQLLPYTGNSIRIGITGVPGAGKSTLIEALGTMLCEQGNRVAVLAVDPSSTVTGGSILETRPEWKTLPEPKCFYPSFCFRRNPWRGKPKKQGNYADM